MKNPRPQIEKPTPEDDALWEILGKSPPPEASAFFSRNVMREIRLSEQEPRSFWQKFVASLRRPSIVTGVAAALIALVTILCVTLVPHSQSNSSELANAAPSGKSKQTLTNYLDEELLLVAADEPDLFSDEEVIAMLF
jgi:uncharacterized membrane protein YdfJ with MMPL/SSD domain